MAQHDIERERDLLRQERDRLQLLIEVNNAVTSHLNLHELLKATSFALRSVIPHDAAGMALYDAEKNQLRVNVLHAAPEMRHAEEGYLMALEGTPAGKAFTTRQPVVVSHLNTKDFPSPIMELALAAGYKSSVNVPLIFQGVALGAAFIGSRTESAFSDADAQLFSNIALQLAISVENALNFERAERERERCQLLLEINNAVVSSLDLRDLLKVISQCLRQVIPHDASLLTLYESESAQLRVHALDSQARAKAPFEEGVLIAMEGTPEGEAINSRRPVLVGPQVDLKRFSSPWVRQAFEDGVRSGVAMPLISHNRALGALSVVSLREDAFNNADVELLSQCASQIAIAVENALSYRETERLKNKLASEKVYLEEEIKSEYNFAEIVGQSIALKKILQQVETVAPTDSTILLCGETGTGKELIARAIHDMSARRERTLVKLNCAAIPTGLLESELFGHEKGAFTGAIAQRIGRFELANKGTLLLDEVGEIPLDLQPKLLRVLQEHEFERLGSSRTIKTDARLIAATNCDLPQMVAEKKFRSDLFYRLNVFPITIPPLRERTEDIPLLAGYFAKKHSLRMKKRIDTISKATVAALCAYPWPGNVRELENFIERAVILTTGSELQAPLSELKTGTLRPSPLTPTSFNHTSLEDVERAHIEDILRQTRGVIGGKGGAAEILGLPISTLRGRIKKLGLK
jgi:formate hydrogenlyase transcriptional activator